MDVVKQNVRKDSTSCNFCQKAELNRLGMGLVYPYETVVTFKRENGIGLCAAICEDCLDELHSKAKIEFKSDK